MGSEVELKARERVLDFLDEFTSGPQSMRNKYSDSLMTIRNSDGDVFQLKIADLYLLANVSRKA